jgi:DNA repair photolyase
MRQPLTLHARGAADNPANRFEPLHYELDPDEPLDEQPDPRTVFLRDSSRSIIATNDSPDVGFNASINPYRGCEHGCIYCYARPTHEYLGFSSGLDFETKILVKEEAPALLRRELMSKRWQPQLIGLSGVTDCYQPIERKLRLTRGCLEVLAEFRNPVAIVTKNHLVTRDVDLLAELAKHHAAAVFVSLTTFDNELKKRMEPRTSPIAGRLAAMKTLAQAGVKVGALAAPVIPGLNDHELPELLEAARDAGAERAGFVMLRLPHALTGLFADWLERNYPEKKDRVLSRIRDLRGGELNDSRFVSRMTGEGPIAEATRRLFQVTCQRLGLNRGFVELSTAHFRRPGERQGELFG